MQFRRIFILMATFLLMFSLLLGKIFYYQIMCGEEISKKAIAMRTDSLPIKQIVRGPILDCNQLPLTDKSISNALYLMPYEILRNYPNEGGDYISNEEKSANLARILASKIENLNSQEIEDKLHNAWEKRKALVRLNSNLSEEDIRQVKQLNFPGLVIAPLINRYDSTGFCQHILGYVKGEENTEGVTGIEKLYNNILKENQASSSLVSVSDAKGKPIPGLMFKVRASDNKNAGAVVLTIDRKIQQIVEDMINHKVKKGLVIIMDIHSKEILALASRPVFNPYNLSSIIVDSEDSPLSNRAVSKYYPGSLFKILVAAAALEEKVVTLDEQFYCEGAYKFTDKLSTSCWKKEGHGELTFTEAFAASCNPVFIELGLRLKKAKLEDYVKRFHLTDGTIVGWEQSDKTNGFVKINPGSAGIGNACLGQQGVMLTPLAITNLIATMADNGRWGQPSLVKYTINKNGERQLINKQVSAQVISEDTAQKVRLMMEEVVLNGTGKSAHIPDFQVAGKTATSQTGNYEEDGEILNTWFGGYFPADNPKWAMLVLVEAGSSGAVDAAPIFKGIAGEIASLFSLANN